MIALVALACAVAAAVVDTLALLPRVPAAAPVSYVLVGLAVAGGLTAVLLALLGRRRGQPRAPGVRTALCGLGLLLVAWLVRGHPEIPADPPIAGVELIVAALFAERIRRVRRDHRAGSTMHTLAGAVVLLLACASPSAAPVEIVVAAASDLASAMPQLATAFEAESGVRVIATLGSSGQLAEQAMQGAPVDVFLSADRASADRLEQAGRIEPGTRAVYAHGTLVLLAGRVTHAPSSIVELAGEEYSRIALANPEHAPYGLAAQQALESAGIHGHVQRRLIIAENVRQAVQFAETRSVDVSIAALSLMDSTRHVWTRVPPELHEPLAQTAAVIADRPHADAARAFVAFLTGPTGRDILARHQFVLP